MSPVRPTTVGHAACWYRLFVALASTAYASPTRADSKPRPQLFMDLETDVVDPWGLLEQKPTALVANLSMNRPPVNYTAGATVFAAFSALGSPGEYEVFVAVGRPGEPLLQKPVEQPPTASPTLAAESMKVVNDANAISAGPHATIKTFAECEAACTANVSCLQWTWNLRSHHCFSSSRAKWDPTFSDHCISGCRSGQVAGCGSSPNPKPPPTPAPPGGVAVQRFTTRDFVSYSNPTTVLYLPNNSPGGEGQTEAQERAHLGDGGIWTVKSMDRNDRGYLLLAFYGDSCSAFAAPLTLGPHSFKTTRKGGVFKDHDDSNLIWSRSTDTWVDMQIMSSPWRLPNGSTTICPHNLSDNGGCKGGPRTVSIRTSLDGTMWSGDWGCATPARTAPVDPAVRTHCATYNESAIVRPHPTEDPPEMQFYRIRPFYLADSGRLAAHALQYAASPAEVNNISSYGYWGPYCEGPNGGFQMCHKGHGYGKMHGPHMMEEWWVSSAPQAGPEDLAGWRRPFKRFRAVPHDVWLMSQPVTYGGVDSANVSHLWVSDTAVYQLPLYRLAGIFAVANGEFSTKPFAVPTLAEGGLSKLWLNADASWKGNLVTGGCDEGCAAVSLCNALSSE
jgi:hypothetical protein